MAAGLQHLIQTHCSHSKFVVVFFKANLGVIVASSQTAAADGGALTGGPAEPSDCAHTCAVKVG